MTPPSLKPRRVVSWHRTDLRTHDNYALEKVVELKPEFHWPIWTWDPTYVYSHRVGPVRWQFLVESLEDFSSALTRIEPSSRLVVLRGDPISVFERILKEWKIDTLVFEVDTAGYARARDAAVLKLAEDLGVEVIKVQGATLYDVEAVVKNNKGKPTMTVAQWAKAAEPLDAPALPLPEPASLPPLGPIEVPDSGFLADGWEAPDDLNGHVHGGFRAAPPTCYSPSERRLTTVPSLESLGLTSDLIASPPLIPGGQTAALHRLSRLMADSAWVAAFHKPNSAPTATLGDFMEGEVWRSDAQGKSGTKEKTGGSTCVLSMFLKFGCLSIRKYYYDIETAIANLDKKKTKVTLEPENLHGQLKFREMYRCADFANPNSSHIRGNAYCRAIDWKCGTKYDGDGQVLLPRPRDEDEDAEAFLDAWTYGRTGFPWIDACMRQLRAIGWIHHLQRHSVACFLTRGQGYIDWMRGEEVFAELLLDWEPSANENNWKWLSCSAFFHQYHRVYSPVAFPKKYDSTGALVRKWCPELKDYPDKFIYEPWNAPQATQQKAKCIIGIDYPQPIVDAKAAQASAVARIKSAFAVKMQGDDPRVLDGTWIQVLRDAYEASPGKVAAVEVQGGTAEKPKRLNPFEQAKAGGSTPKKAKKK